MSVMTPGMESVGGGGRIGFKGDAGVHSMVVRLCIEMHNLLLWNRV